VTGRTGDMDLATTVLLPVMRGAAATAKTLAALDVLSEGRLIAALGPGSSERDYAAVNIPFDERWKRFDVSVAEVRALLEGTADLKLEPPPRRPGGIPLWIGSWGSKAGLRRVARDADGWLASAYNTTPELFGEARQRLAGELEARGRDHERFPNALSTMWTWVAEDPAEAERVLNERLAPMLNRDPGDLRDRLCIGTPEHCAAVLSAYGQAGCRRVYVWPLGEEPRQIELLATRVLPCIVSGRPG
jgi:alkanesulfonate monooxygenase SsuD/methylene tetrahydromethanopterin reductase-like flavin-dependent oxidoreductase (luciferase family)